MEAEGRRQVAVGEVALECSPAVEGVAAEVPDNLASGRGRHPGSGFPWHTCIAGRPCHIASAPRTPPRRPGHSP